MLIGNPMGAALEVLTHRERDVALLLARGMRNGDIAATLRISPATARRHTERIFRKLGVQTRAAAAALIAAQHARPRGRRNAPV
jgi:DNA-binding CsgD family transcriptional regulator